jgi:hypothetical protein
MSLIVLDPVQQPLAADAASTLPTAPRLSTLNGKTVGLWSNQKLNASRILEMVRAELAARYRFDVVHGVYDPGALQPEDGWGELARCDAVIMATGDCGACSTSGIANAIEIEKRGIPAVLISTKPFFQAVTTTAQLRGMPDITWAVVEHPLGSLDEAALAERAKAATPQVLELLLAAEPKTSAA